MGREKERKEEGQDIKEKKSAIKRARRPIVCPARDILLF